MARLRLRGQNWLGTDDLRVLPPRPEHVLCMTISKLLCPDRLTQADVKEVHGNTRVLKERRKEARRKATEKQEGEMTLVIGTWGPMDCSATTVKSHPARLAWT